MTTSYPFLARSSWASAADRAGIRSLSVADDGTSAIIVESARGVWRLRTVRLVGNGTTGAVESPVAISDPIPRPNRSGILYRRGGKLWLVNYDGAQNYRLRVAPGAGPAIWSSDGRAPTLPSTSTSAGTPMPPSSPGQASARRRLLLVQSVSGSSLFANIVQTTPPRWLPSFRPTASGYFFIAIDMARRRSTRSASNGWWKRRIRRSRFVSAGVARADARRREKRQMATFVVAITASSPSRVSSTACAARIMSASRGVSSADCRPIFLATAQNSAAFSITDVVIGA